ncbi:PAC2 family protein [Candidatus Micrarchaeota archaeon]|nr:PAC2 family protein [Candidatus Micrarchaeota archaeon]
MKTTEKTESKENFSLNQSITRVRPGFEGRKFENALMIVGLPGIGLVSKMAVDQLTRVLKAEKIAFINSPHFPNQVLALKNGRLRAFSIKFYHKKLNGKNLVLVRGDLQPLTVEGQYEVSGKILELARDFGVQTVIAMAGYATNAKIEKKPVIYYSATSSELAKKIASLGGKKPARVVPVVGMSGLVPALARVYGLQGVCLLVETPGTIIDATGAKALLELLEKFLGKKIDVAELDKRAKNAEKALRKFEEQAMQAQKLGGAPALTEPLKKELTYIR